MLSARYNCTAVAHVSPISSSQLLAAVVCFAIPPFFRVREIKAVKMLVDRFLPFSFFSSTPSWQELSGVLTADEAPFSPLSARRVKHVVVEMYLATKKVSCDFLFLFSI